MYVVTLSALVRTLGVADGCAVYESQAPSGMMGRGHYDANMKFIDDDNVTHLKFDWSFDVAKDW